MVGTSATSEHNCTSTGTDSITRVTQLKQKETVRFTHLRNWCHFRQLLEMEFDGFDPEVPTDFKKRRLNLKGGMQT